MYVTKAELGIDDVTLAQIAGVTDDSTEQETTDLITAVVAEDIDAACDLINGFLRGRYVVPLTETPLLIKQIARGLTRFYLWSRIPHQADTIKQMGEIAEKDTKKLEMIQRGRITLDVDTPSTPAAVDFRTNKTSADRFFTAELLSRF